ncbi:MAG: phosphate signaling complex protein PhoU [Actinomycetes bacterium]
MRDQYHEQLQTVTADLVEMTRLAGSAMTRAATALLDADLELAETVIAADEHIDDLREHLDQRVCDLMARQQPVAGDLRALVAALRMSADLERMGDLARHVARTARMRHPQSVIPPELRATVLEMSQVAERIVTKAGSVIASHDVTAAHELERDDDDMDRLHSELLRTLLDDSFAFGVETAVDVALVGRYYERFADHAVSVARRVVYLVTGAFPAVVAP